MHSIQCIDYRYITIKLGTNVPVRERDHSVHRFTMSKKAIKKRNASGEQKCDVCQEVEFLEGHHIRGRRIRNFDDPFNIANICPNCHFKVHLGEFIIENWVNSTSGRILIWHKKDEDSKTGNDASTHII